MERLNPAIEKKVGDVVDLLSNYLKNHLEEILENIVFMKVEDEKKASGEVSKKQGIEITSDVYEHAKAITERPSFEEEVFDKIDLGIINRRSVYKAWFNVLLSFYFQVLMSRIHINELR